MGRQVGAPALRLADTALMLALMVVCTAWVAMGGRVDLGRGHPPIVTSCAELQVALGSPGDALGLQVLVEGSLECGPGAWATKIAVNGSL